MIYESRRASVLRTRLRRRTTAAAEGEAFYGELSGANRLRKRIRYENRFRTHLAIELWNYARRRELLDPAYPACPKNEINFAKFANEQELFIDGLMGMAESIPAPPYNPQTTDLSLLIAANIGARKSQRIQDFVIEDIVRLIESAHAKAKDERGESSIWKKVS